MWGTIWPAIVSGLVLTILGYLGAKSKKVSKHIGKIWHTSSKAILSETQFNELKRLLRPIQPDANGGKSLNDLHIKFDIFQKETREDFRIMSERQVDLGDATARLEGGFATHIGTKYAHED